MSERPSEHPGLDRPEVQRWHRDTLDNPDPHLNRAPDEFRHGGPESASFAWQSPGADGRRLVTRYGLRAVSWARERPDLVLGLLGGLIVLGVGGWLGAQERARSTRAARWSRRGHALLAGGAWLRRVRGMRFARRLAGTC